MDEQISIFDYAKVIINGRKTIFMIIFFSVIFTFIFTVYKPLTFEGKLALEIGESNGKRVEDAYILTERVRLQNPHLRVETTEGGYSILASGEKVRTVQPFLIIKYSGTDSEKVENILQSLFDDIYQKHSGMISEDDEDVKETTIIRIDVDQKEERLSVNLLLSVILGAFISCFFVLMKEWWKNEQKA